MKNLLFLLLFSPVLANAQKLVKDETDRFTKEQVKETDWNKLVFKGMNAVRIMAKKANDKVSVDFKVARHGNKLMTVHEGDYVMLLLDDDNAIKMKIASWELSETNRGARASRGGGDFESLEIPTEALSPEDIRSLKGHSVKAVRIYLGNKDPLEFDVDDKFKDAVKDCLTLVTI